MPKTSSRISGFTESVIRRMTRIANQFGAINFHFAKKEETLAEAGERLLRIRDLWHADHPT